MSQEFEPTLMMLVDLHATKEPNVNFLSLTKYLYHVFLDGADTKVFKLTYAALREKYDV